MSNFTLVQLEPETHSKSQKFPNDFVLQRTLLRDDTAPHEFIAHCEVSLAQSPRYGVYWSTDLLGDQYMRLCEECLIEYEQSYEEGVPNLHGRRTNPYGIWNPYVRTEHGVIVSFRDRFADLELRYERPLRWWQVIDAAQGLEVVYVRYITPVCSFVYDSYGDHEPILGIMSNVTYTSPFARLIAQTSNRNVTFQEASYLFRKALRPLMVSKK